MLMFDKQTNRHRGKYIFTLISFFDDMITKKSLQFCCMQMCQKYVQNYPI